jgi:hypothetical protein
MSDQDMPDTESSATESEQGAEFETGTPMSDEADVVEREPYEQPSEEQPARMRPFLRRALLWLVGLLGVFALGIAATWFTQVMRLQRENAALGEEIAAVEAEAETEIASIREQLGAEIKALNESLAESELEIELLNALVDVSSAQVAFELGDEVGVRAALAGTDDRLAMLQRELSPDGAAAVDALRERLETVLDELGSDSDAVEEELERLSVNLLALERSLFGD